MFFCAHVTGPPGFLSETMSVPLIASPVAANRTVLCRSPPAPPAIVTVTNYLGVQRHMKGCEAGLTSVLQRAVDELPSLVSSPGSQQFDYCRSPSIAFGSSMLALSLSRRPL